MYKRQAIHEQAKQSKAIVEAAENKITEKIESIRVEFDSAIALNNTRVTECETRMIAVEECMREQTAAVNESINTHENKLEALEQKIKQIQQTTPIANQVTYVYKTQDDINTYMKFYGLEHENPIQFLMQCQRNMEHIADNLSDVDKINWVVRQLKGTAAEWFSICLLYTSRCV